MKDSQKEDLNCLKFQLNELKARWSKDKNDICKTILNSDTFTNRVKQIIKSEVQSRLDLHQVDIETLMTSYIDTSKFPKSIESSPLFGKPDSPSFSDLLDTQKKLEGQILQLEENYRSVKESVADKALVCQYQSQNIELKFNDEIRKKRDETQGALGEIHAKLQFIPDI